MKKLDGLRKIVFKDNNHPVLVFCPQTYKGYHIRGQVQEFSDINYEGRYPEGHVYAYYRSTLIVLINDKYVRGDEQIEVGDAYGYFDYKTIDEYKEEIRENEKYYLEGLIEQEAKVIAKNNEIKKHEPKALAQYLENKRKESLKDYHNKKNDPVIIDIKDVNIIETPYVHKALELKSDIILIRKSISFERPALSSNLSKVDCPKHIYCLCAVHDSNSAFNSTRYITHMVELLPGLYSSDEGTFDLTSAKKYSSGFDNIGEVASEWIKTRTLSRQGIELLNILYLNLKDKEDPYKEYYLTFLNDLISDLKVNKIIGQCSFCWNFLKYHPTKKRCSKASEGKACGKKASNQRYYGDNKDKILPNARIQTKEQRELLKKHGVKK